MIRYKEYNELNKNNYWVIFKYNMEVIHVVGYLEEPQEQDIISLKNELKYDKDFLFPIHILDNSVVEIMNKQKGLEVVYEFIKD